MTGLVYLDSTVVPETTYFYRVRTILRTGDTSMPSNSDMGRALLNAARYIPAFTASDGSFADRVLLSWRKPFTGIRVIVSSSDSATASWAAICTTAVDTMCWDSLVTPGPHLYRFAAVNDSQENTEYFFDNGYRTVTDTVFVTGIYPGAIVYNINVDHSNPVSGAYTVIQQGKAPAATTAFRRGGTHLPVPISRYLQ